MKKWPTVMIAVVVTLVTAWTMSATAQTPKPTLVAKPGDLIRLSGTPKVCGVNEATPRGKFSKDKVTSITCWTVTLAGTPMPSSQVTFAWAWPTSQAKSLAGYTFWDSRAVKLERPKANAVFTKDTGWSARYTRDPFAVTENQRLSRKTKVLLTGQTFEVRLTKTFSIGCDYIEGGNEIPDQLSCLPFDRNWAGEDKMIFGFIAFAPWQPENSVVYSFNPACSCGQRATP